MVTQITQISIGTPLEWLRKGRDGFGRAVLKPALEEAITYWHTHFLPRHFRSGAAGRYGYPRRTRQTMARKIRRVRQGFPDARLPLIMTGRTRLRSKTARVSGSSRSARVTMSLPIYVQQYDVNGRVTARGRASGGYKAQVAADMTRMSRDELDKIARIIDREISRRLKEFPGRTIKRT